MTNERPEVETLTVEDLEAWARKQDRTRTNPVITEGEFHWCVYTGTDGDHCIAGQFLADNGRELPELDSFGNTLDIKVLANLKRYYNLTPDALDKLAELQDAADGPAQSAIAPPWGEAIDKVFGQADV